MFLDSLIDDAAATELVTDAWLAGLPDDQLPPGEADLRWFSSYLARDPVFAAGTASAQAALRERALRIERTTPMVSKERRALPVPHRLFAALEIAKFVQGRTAPSLFTLRSVVIYPDAGRVLKGRPAVGFAALRGPRHVLRHLDAIDGTFVALTPVIEQSGKAQRRNRKDTRALARQREQLARWRTRLGSDDYEPVAEAGQVIAYLEGLASELRPLLLRTVRALAPDLGAQDYKKLEESVALAAEHITWRAALITKASDSLSSANASSVHISWMAQIAGRQTPHDNILVHELAHVLDFEHGGPDGCPSPSAPGRAIEPFEQRWAAAYEQATRGEFTSLGDYARTDPLELFAVSSEHFFSCASALRANAPALFELLVETYGYVPADRRPASWLGSIRTLFLSRLRAL